MIHIKYTHILWDWNGTLIDDLDISIECVNILLDELNLERTNIDEYKDMMDTDIKKYYKRLFESRNRPTPYELCAQNYHENYTLLIDKARLSRGAKEILEFFRNTGAKQYIVSAFEENALKEHVRKFGIEEYFEQISGCDDIHAGPKDKRALELINGIDKDKILYIGDLETDFETANAVGCDCVLYSGGHQPREFLEKFGCPVIDNLIELKELNKNHDA